MVGAADKLEAGNVGLVEMVLGLGRWYFRADELGGSHHQPPHDDHGQPRLVIIVSGEPRVRWSGAVPEGFSNRFEIRPRRLLLTFWVPAVQIV